MSESTNHLFWLPEIIGCSSGWAGTVTAGPYVIPRGYLLFKKNETESWCLPLSHLISYSHSPGGALELKFTTHCMLLDCGTLDIREVVGNILKDTISLIETRTAGQPEAGCLFVRGLQEGSRDDYLTEEETKPH